MSTSLMDRTHALLLASDRTLPDIYADLSSKGSEINFYWLRKFRSGEIKHPSVNRVQELYEYLSGVPLLPN